MDFFIIFQDSRIHNYIEPKGFIKAPSNNMDSKESLNIPIVINVKEKVENEYIDFMEKPVPLVSDKLKQLIGLHQKEILFKPVVLTDAKRMRQDLYWMIIPRKIECLSPESEFNKRGELKNLILQKDKIKNKNVFMIEGIVESHIIVSQFMAEEILRNNFYGMRFKKV